MKKVISLIFNIICTVFLLGAVILLVFSLTMQSTRRVPRIFGISVIYILSDSMQPDFGKGDIAFVRDVPVENIEVGDIIAFYAEDDTTDLSDVYFHRVTDKKDGADGDRLFKTKGDANTRNDFGWVKQQNIIGVYSGDNEPLQSFLTFVLSKMGIIFLIIIPSGLVFAFELLTLISLIPNKDEKVRQAAGVAQGGDTAHGPTDGADGRKIVILPNKKKRAKIQLSVLLRDIDFLKSKPRATGRMIMKKALLLEKCKTSTEYRNDIPAQQKIREALNWCYCKLGDIQYKNTKGGKDNEKV